MDEYSDMVAVAKPVVYITVGELLSTHRVRAAAGGRWEGGLALGGRPGSAPIFGVPRPAAAARAPGLGRPRALRPLA